MKKYILLTPTISDMGGAQMYIRNKAIVLERQGWVLFVMCGRDDNVVISELKSISHRIPEINFNPFLFPLKKRERLIKEFKNVILPDNNDEIVIESTCLSESLWGEMFAREIKAKHFIYLLQEDNIIESKLYFDFLSFKLSRHELAAIDQMSLYKMFYPWSQISIDESKRASLPACCTNVVEDISSPFEAKIDSAKFDYRIGVLTRLEKPFLIPTIKKIVDFANNNKENSFILLVIGGSPIMNKINKIIRSLKEKTHNLDICITGYMYPVSRSLINKCDVFVSSAGSAYVTYEEGIPTISIDGKDYEPIGVMGYTTNNCLFRENEPIVLLDELLKEVLFDKKYIKTHSVSISGPTIEQIIDEHNKFIKESDLKVQFFSFPDEYKCSSNEKPLKFGLTLLGCRGYQKLSHIKNSLFIK